MSSPVQYTSRTFQSIMTDINSDADLIDKPDWWKRIMAGVGDVLNAYLNAQANNSFLRTGFTRQAVADLTELIDYALSEASTGTGVVLFDLISAVGFPVAIAVADLVALTTGTIAVSAKRYEGRTAVSIAAQVTGTFTADHTTEQLTVTRDFTNTEKVRLTTSGTLPTGLALATDYWVIRSSATILQLATTRANAIAGTAVTFSDNGSGTHTWNLLTAQVTMWQQSAVASYVAGVADPTVSWQEIDLADKFVLRDTLVVTINSVIWSVLGTGALTSTHVFSGPADQHVRLVFNSDGSSKLRFGDGTYGEIPGAFDVNVEYAVGGGADSNASAGTLVVYGGSDADVENVYNVAASTGGGNAESLATAKVLAPLLLKARDRFVTSEDGVALTLAFAGVSQAAVNKNEFGVLSAQVLAIALGGGNLSSANQALLQTHLIDRTILEEMDVRVEDATITSKAVTSAAKMLGGFTYATIEPYIELAWKLFFTETGKEIKDDFDENGIASATTLLNTIFSTSFVAADYAQIEILIENLTARTFGETINESDALGYVDSFVTGVDYVTVTVPSFPIALATDEITTDGALTLSEIP